MPHWRETHAISQVCRAANWLAVDGRNDISLLNTRLFSGRTRRGLGNHSTFSRSVRLACMRCQILNDYTNAPAPHLAILTSCSITRRAMLIGTANPMPTNT